MTFAEFARVMRSRGIDPTYLVKRFRTDFGDGTAEVRAFFEQVFDRRCGDRVVPYRSVIDFYEREIGANKSASPRERRCACGCGQTVFGRKKGTRASSEATVDGSSSRKNNREKPRECWVEPLTVSGNLNLAAR